MTEPSLPNDILHEIGKYWNGHSLLYTCTALYESWRPDQYLVTESRKVKDHLSPDITTWTTITRMPNGIYHGRCTNKLWRSGKVVANEIIEYNRGDVMSTTHNSRGYYRVMRLNNGWCCRWRKYEGEKPDDIFDALGLVDIMNSVGPWDDDDTLRIGVTLRDFIAVASGMVAQRSEHGGISELSLLSDWGWPMPGTRR